MISFGLYFYASIEDDIELILWIFFHFNVVYVNIIWKLMMWSKQLLSSIYIDGEHKEDELDEYLFG